MEPAVYSAAIVVCYVQVRAAHVFVRSRGRRRPSRGHIAEPEAVVGWRTKMAVMLLLSAVRVDRQAKMKMGAVYDSRGCFEAVLLASVIAKYATSINRSAERFSRRDFHRKWNQYQSWYFAINSLHFPHIIIRMNNENNNNICVGSSLCTASNAGLTASQPRVTTVARILLGVFSERMVWVLMAKTRSSVLIQVVALAFPK